MSILDSNDQHLSIGKNFRKSAYVGIRRASAGEMPLITGLVDGLRDQQRGGTTTTIVGSRSIVHRRTSWAAIFGCVLLVVAIQLLFSLLGAGISLGTVDVTAGDSPSASSIGIGASLWWVISSCLALGFGSFVAAWLIGLSDRFDGVLHGLVTWGVASSSERLPQPLASQFRYRGATPFPVTFPTDRPSNQGSHWR